MPRVLTTTIEDHVSWVLATNIDDHAPRVLATNFEDQVPKVLATNSEDHVSRVLATNSEDHVSGVLATNIDDHVPRVLASNIDDRGWFCGDNTSDVPSVKFDGFWLPDICATIQHYWDYILFRRGSITLSFLHPGRCFTHRWWGGGGDCSVQALVHISLLLGLRDPSAQGFSGCGIPHIIYIYIYISHITILCSHLGSEHCPTKYADVCYIYTYKI